MPTSDAELLLESLNTFKVTKSHLVSCGLCNHAAPHAMRVRLLACKCPICDSVAPYASCPWRGKTLACQHLNLMRVEEAGAHVSPAPSPACNHLTPPMKEAAREWAAQGLKPSRIRSGFLRRFNLDEESLPPLSVVQRFVHNYAASHLRNNDVLATLKAKIRKVAFTGSEEGSEAFTFAWENDVSGRPIVGNGSDNAPFITGVTTKKLLQRADRDPNSYVLHLDATYKLCQVAYPVLVIGISDKVRSFHLVAIVIMSQQMQPHYARALAALSSVYQAVMQKPLMVRYVMSDVDKAQRNAVEEIFGVDCSVVHLMCWFHVAKKVYEKAKNLESSLFAMVLRDVHDLHFAVSDHEFEQIKSRVLAEWTAWPELASFASYFTSTWLTGRFSTW